MSPNESIHARIRRLRKERGLNQGELAVLADTTQSTISALELGRKPSVEMAGRLAHVFGMAVEELDPYAGLRARAGGKVIVTYLDDQTPGQELPEADWRENLPTLARVLETGATTPTEQAALELIAEAIEGRIVRRRK